MEAMVGASRRRCPTSFLIGPGATRLLWNKSDGRAVRPHQLWAARRHCPHVRMSEPWSCRCGRHSDGGAIGTKAIRRIWFGRMPTHARWKRALPGKHIAVGTRLFWRGSARWGNVRHVHRERAHLGCISRHPAGDQWFGRMPTHARWKRALPVE